MLAIQLPPEIEARIEALAKATGRSPSSYALEAILEHLDDIEDITLAERRLSALQAGETKPVPLDDIMRQHGLAD